MSERSTFRSTRLAVLCLLASAALPIKSSVALEGTFEKWEAPLTFTSTDVTTGVLDIKIQAASVDTGSGMKDGKIKGKDFFDVEHNPLITFHSDKLVQTGPPPLICLGRLQFAAPLSQRR